MADEKREQRVDAAMDELGFCGCGSPEEVLSLLLDALEWCGAPNKAKLNRSVEPLNERGLMLALYVADDRDLIEHGGSVIGGWLTEKGRAFLETYRTVIERRS